MKFRLEVQTWCSDLMFRLEFRLGNLQSQIEDWRFSRTLPRESSIPDWRLKIEDFPGLSLENLQSRIIFNPGLKIEDWRFSRTLPGESSIPDWRLKIFQDSPWRIFNPGLKIEDWRFSRTLPGESSIPDWRLKIFSWIKDSPTRVLRNLQSSIFNPGLKILQQESWGIFNLQSRIKDSPTRLLGNLQSSILDWRFSNKAPGESSIFNLQSWTSSLRSFCTWGIWSIFVKGLRLHLHSTVCSSRPEALPLCLQSTYRTRCRSQCKAVSPWRTTRHW